MITTSDDSEKATYVSLSVDACRILIPVLQSLHSALPENGTTTADHAAIALMVGAMNDYVERWGACQIAVSDLRRHVAGKVRDRVMKLVESGIPSAVTGAMYFARTVYGDLLDARCLSAIRWVLANADRTGPMNQRALLTDVLDLYASDDDDAVLDAGWFVQIPEWSSMHASRIENEAN